MFRKKQKNQNEYKRSTLDKVVDILSAATEKDKRYKTHSKPKYKKQMKHKKNNDWNAKITW